MMSASRSRVSRSGSVTMRVALACGMDLPSLTRRGDSASLLLGACGQRPHRLSDPQQRGSKIFELLNSGNHSR